MPNFAGRNIFATVTQDMHKKILLLAATELEIRPLNSFLKEQDAVDVLIAGIGGVSTTYGLTRQLARQRYDLVLQAGIGGSLANRYAPGTVAVINRECFGDLGVVEEGRRRSVFDLQLAPADAPPFTGGWLLNPYDGLMALTGLDQAKGVTVNEITTSKDTIRHFRNDLGAEIESMEGAALHYVALQEAVPFLQVRAVSNYAGERDKTKWALGASVSKLNEIIEQLIRAFIA
ncbi:futalosine hydrolase [Niabella drilacis]|uniref:Futalosine hydrolase n=1 Tax=Niabella drilacis (strain DSM 25811 / CCM 8410 / CCUG 62505 / LMG 26954 / E90) TaxID=1285928 RepID=A0A1G7BMH2_NIADE|nr:futalosine hydrolase [Niabella drilacis]SDE28137.1 futalosine hydrolase [Niabella drilacis]